MVLSNFWQLTCSGNYIMRFMRKLSSLQPALFSWLAPEVFRARPLLHPPQFSRARPTRWTETTSSPTSFKRPSQLPISSELTVSWSDVQQCEMIWLKNLVVSIPSLSTINERASPLAGTKPSAGWNITRPGTRFQTTKVAPYLFFATHTFLGTMLAQKSISSFFFGTHTFFLEPVLFSAQCLARKNVISFLLEPILFLAECLAWTCINSFFWNSYFFETHAYFVTMFGPKKKNEFLFFWNPHFFWQCLARKHVGSFFVGTHTFFVRMRGLNMYEVAFFPGTFFFELRCCDEINVGNCQRIPFSRTLTLNNFAVQLCFCFCGSLFHFIDIIEILFLWNPFVFCQRVMLFACVL